ncbi:MAG: amidase [Candidatus Thorarchaeota archaeon]
MKVDDYIHFDALGLAELIRSKQISPKELLDVAIVRAEQCNLVLNAITLKMYDIAYEYIHHKKYNGEIFFGVPFLLKDLDIFYSGTTTSFGSKAFKKFKATHDSEIVKRFKQSGLVIFGKTNIPELGVGFNTDSDLWGQCYNPWDLTRIPGGSSGGAAASVASRIVPMAHGSDWGGSIRVPAACCGVFGFKPTRGLTPNGPDVGEFFSGCGSQNALTITVRDSAAMLDSISGASLGDPHATPTKPPSFLVSIKTPPRKLKIAYSYSILNIPVNEECIKACNKSLKICENLGHDVEENYPKYNQEEMNEAYKIIISANIAMEINLQEKRLGHSIAIEDLEEKNILMIKRGKKYTAADYAQALRTIHFNSRKIALFYDVYDILITPTTTQPPLQINSLGMDKKGKITTLFCPYASIVNLTGQPAMSVPLHWTKENIPIGTHFIGRWGKDETLLKLARQLEIAYPWHKRFPELSLKINESHICTNLNKRSE